MFFDRLFQLFRCDLVRSMLDEQQIQILIRFYLAFPFVFHRLDTFKL